MIDGPLIGKQNTIPGGFVNQIKDQPTRMAILEVFRQLGILTTAVTQVGHVTRPLTTALDAGSNQLKRLQDPSDPSDAVTLRFLQSYVANVTAVLGGSDVPGDPATGTAPAPTDQSGIVESVRVSLGISASSTPFELFKFAQTVVWQIAALGIDPVAGNVGLLMQDSGDGTYLCPAMGPQVVACFRLCYDNGANIKILTGSYTTQWTQEADIALSQWHAPTDPGSVCP